MFSIFLTVGRLFPSSYSAFLSESEQKGSPSFLSLQKRFLVLPPSLLLDVVCIAWSQGLIIPSWWICKAPCWLCIRPLMCCWFHLGIGAVCWQVLLMAMVLPSVLLRSCHPCLYPAANPATHSTNCPLLETGWLLDTFSDTIQRVQIHCGCC